MKALTEFRLQVPNDSDNSAPRYGLVALFYFGLEVGAFMKPKKIQKGGNSFLHFPDQCYDKGG